MRSLKFTLIQFILAVFFVFTPLNYSQAENTNVYFFHGDGCPHCAKEEEYLEKIKKETNLQFEIRKYEIWKNKENSTLLKELAENQNWSVTGVPFTVIGDETFTGYLNDEFTGTLLKNKIEECNRITCTDSAASFIEAKSLEFKEKNNNLKKLSKTSDLKITDNKNTTLPPTLNLPLIGELETQNLSLPIITIIIAAIDGFNPCAMWVLIFLISMLLGMQDKKRRWIFGGAFIIASGLVYFMFLAAWLNIILFIGLIAGVRMTIGLVALGTGIYSIRDYYTNPHAVCKITNNEKRKKVFENLKKFVHEKSFWLALCGIIVLAAAVNLVELICSAGLPAVFTQILALSNLPTWKYYSYMALYIIIFMLDDIIVFAIAMKTLEIKSISSKFTRYSSLIGGIIMLILGAMLIIKPEWLMFG